VLPITDIHSGASEGGLCVTRTSAAPTIFCTRAWFEATITESIVLTDVRGFGAGRRQGWSRGFATKPYPTCSCSGITGSTPLGSLRHGARDRLAAYSQDASTTVLLAPCIKFSRLGLWVMPLMPREGGSHASLPHPVAGPRDAGRPAPRLAHGHDRAAR
jgi:hypothetical protein